VGGCLPPTAAADAPAAPRAVSASAPRRRSSRRLCLRPPSSLLAPSLPPPPVVAPRAVSASAPRRRSSRRLCLRPPARASPARIRPGHDLVTFCRRAFRRSPKPPPSRPRVPRPRPGGTLPTGLRPFPGSPHATPTSPDRPRPNFRPASTSPSPTQLRSTHDQVTSHQHPRRHPSNPLAWSVVRYLWPMRRDSDHGVMSPGAVESEGAYASPPTSSPCVGFGTEGRGRRLNGVLASYRTQAAPSRPERMN